MGSTPSGISGSRAAAVLGENPFKTPMGVALDIIEDIEPGWSKKNGFKYEPFTGNASTRFGNAFENDIIDISEHIGLCKINEREAEYRHTEHQFISCHIDGMYNDIVPVIHEGKTTTTFSFRDKWGEPGTDHIPREYQIQVQHQMMLTGAKKAIVSVLVFPERPDAWEAMGIDSERILTDRWAWALKDMGFFHQYVVKADPVLHEYLISEYIKFWNNHILARKPPEPNCYNDIKKLLKEPKGTVVASDDIYSLASEYKGITEETSRSGKRKEALKVKIIKYMLDNAEHSIDEDSVEKIVLRDTAGHKLCQFDGKRFG
jgi:predicted phage-related endonuclease